MSSLTTPTVPTTLLDAVNALLVAAHVAPVRSLLSTDLNEEAAEAKQAVDQASIQFQTEGWQFNTEATKVLDPDEAGYIYLPSNTLKVRSARLRSSGDKLVQRGSRLYNPKAGENTFVIGEAVEVDIVVGLEFDDLSSAARLYVTAVAARQWCPTKLPSGATFRWTEEVLQSARVELEREDSDIANEDDLTRTSPHFQNMARR